MLTYTVGSHSRTVLSLEADATKCPDGEKATDNMASYIRGEILQLVMTRGMNYYYEFDQEQMSS